MTFEQKIYDPVFGNDEIKIWATSKQSFDKYLSKAKKCYNLLNTLDLNIKLSPINHIEIVRANIRFYLCSNVTEKVLDYQLCNHRIICRKNVVSIT